MNGVEITLTDYRGRTYDRLHVRRSAIDGPGWYVFGRNEGYGDRLVMLCARPDVPPRAHQHYNCRVRAGWKYKYMAQEVADAMNAMDKLAFDDAPEAVAEAITEAAA